MQNQRGHARPSEAMRGYARPSGALIESINRLLVDWRTDEGIGIEGCKRLLSVADMSYNAMCHFSAGFPHLECGSKQCTALKSRVRLLKSWTKKEMTNISVAQISVMYALKQTQLFDASNIDFCEC